MGTGGVVRLYNFGDLNQTGSDDPDGDGYTITEELALGRESTIEDSVEWGGVSGRLSDGLFMPILPWCCHYQERSGGVCHRVKQLHGEQ